MLVKVTALLAEMAHNKGHTAKKGKGKKKHRVQLDEAQRARLNNIKALAKAEGKKYSERRKLVRDYLKSIKSAQRAAGILPVAVIPRQPRAQRSNIVFSREELTEFTGIKKITNWAKRKEAYRKFFEKVNPDGTGVQAPVAQAAMAELKNLKTVEAVLQENLAAAVASDDIQSAADRLAENLNQQGEVAADAAGEAAAQGNPEAARALDQEAEAANDELNNVHDAAGDAIATTGSRYRPAVFGGGMGRRAMLSRWG